MRTSERRQLKQDKFAETTKELISEAVAHRTLVVWIVVIAVIAVGVGAGSWWYWNSRTQQANGALGRAMETYNTPLRPPGTPASPGMATFANAQERARAAHAQFQQIANQYGHTRPGKVARYMASLTALQMGDTKGGEQELKQVIGAGDRNLSALARLALAGVYRATQRDQDALPLYQELAAHPTDTVSKPVAQLELASLYEETHQPADAGKLYNQIVKESPSSAAASIAEQRLSALKQP